MESTSIHEEVPAINAASPESYNEVSPPGSNEDRTRWLRRYRIMKTFSMVFIWFCMGCYGTMNNTAIDDLHELIGVNYEKFSRAYVSKSAGMLLGSVLVGPLADTFPAKMDLILASSMTVMSGAALVLPLCPSLPLMGVSFCLQGVGQAALSASGNAHVMSMWGQENSSPILSLHFGYAAGNVLGPVLAGPFLSEVPGNTTTNHTQPSLLHSYPYTVADFNYVVNSDVLRDSSKADPGLLSSVLPHTAGNHSESQIWIPYVAAGSLGLVVALAFFVFFIAGLPEEFRGSNRENNSNVGSNARSILSPGTCTNGNIVYGVQFFMLVSLFYITNVGKDASFLTFTLPIAIDKRLPLHFTKKSADLLMIVSSACAALGRFGFALIAKILSIQVIVFIQIFFILVSQVGLVVWGLEYAVVYWVGSCVFNTFSSPLFPSVLAWADKYVQMTAVAVAVVDIATGIGAFLFAWLAGYVFEYKEDGAAWVLYLSTGCGAAMALFMISLQILGSCHGNRFEVAEVNSQDDSDVEPLVA